MNESVYSTLPNNILEKLNIAFKNIPEQKYKKFLKCQEGNKKNFESFSNNHLNTLK